MLKKYTIRLTEGAPQRLAELCGLEANKAIRLIVDAAIRRLEKQEAEGVRRALEDDNLAQSIQEALQ